MNFLIDVLPSYVEKKLLKSRTHPEGDLHIVSYTKNQFFRKTEWDDNTINSRGHVYNRDGILINYPFYKFFNLNEHESTELETIKSLIEEGDYSVMDKIDGHLCIVFYYNGKWYNTTKGTFDHEFVSLDRELLESFDIFNKLESIDHGVTYTYMFEILAEYDQHVVYEQNSSVYGRNVPVLIGIGDPINECYIPPSVWKPITDKLSITSVDLFEHNPTSNIMELFDAKGVEGYVFYFHESNVYVKIKTTEYWFLRNLTEFQNGEKFKKIFVNHFLDSESACYEIPEEVHYIYDKICNDFSKYVSDKKEESMEFLTGIGGDDNTYKKIIEKIKTDNLIGIGAMNIFRGRIVKDSMYKKPFIESYLWEFDIDVKKMFIDR